MKRLLLIYSCFVCANLHGQLLSWTPDFAKDNDNISITMDASKGNQGLKDYTPTSDVYVHIGLITNASANAGDWRYIKFTWGTTNSAAQATYLGNNKWQYTINNIRSFFAVPAGETILRIAMLFRNGAGDANRVQRNTDGSDMYIPIYDNSLALRFTLPLFQPAYTPVPEPISKQVGDNISLTAVANKSSTMKLYLNGVLVQSVSGVTTISANPVLTVSGTQTVMAEANDGTTTRTETFTFYVANVVPLPAGVRDGINYETGNTSAVLVLYAPNKSRITVIGEFPGNNWTEQPNYVMNKTPDGKYWWLRITGLTPGNEYAFQYLVDGAQKIAEPYSEKILDPTYDGAITSATYPGLRSYPTGLTTGVVSILQTNAPSYTWAINSFARPDKRNIVIYELLLRDFLAAHDWKTLRDTLSYLKTMGVNMIEVMPFNEFESNDSWGYNPDFFFAPDKYYGTKNQLKEFIDSCHKKGIAVIMDMVLNHATGLCPLAALYWNSATSQPTPENPWFNVTATHPFSVFNDFNHESLATRYFSSRVMEFWLQEYKMDGFRFDLSKGFTQTNSGSNVAQWSQYDASRIAIWKRYYDTLQLKSPGCYAILEHFADNTEEKELSNYGMLLWGNHNINFSQAAMGYPADQFGNTWNFDGILHSVRGWTNPYLVGYMESHDEERLMYKNIQYGNSNGGYDIKDLNTGLRRIEMCAAFMLASPGPKMIWEFGEVGYDFSINRCADGSINNNCRLTAKPIRWDYRQNVSRKRLYDVYSSLLKLRAHAWYKDVFIANNTAITPNLSGSFKSLTVRSALDSSILCVLGNFDISAQTINFTFPVAGTWYDYLAGTTITGIGASQSITLQAGEYHVFINRNVVNTVLPPVITNASNLQLTIFPNPVQDNSVIEMNIVENGNVAIEILNMMGQKITTVFTGVMSKGKHRISFTTAANNLPKGSYMLRLQSKNKTIATKYIK